MPKKTPGRSQPKFEMQTTWVKGQRTVAWDELWRRILKDVIHGLDHSVIDAVEEPGSE